MTTQPPVLPPRRGLRLVLTAFTAMLAVVFLPSSAWARPDVTGLEYPSGSVWDGGISSDGAVSWNPATVLYHDPGMAGATISLSSQSGSFQYAMAKPYCSYVTGSTTGDTVAEESVYSSYFFKDNPTTITMPSACRDGRRVERIDLYKLDSNHGAVVGGVQVSFYFQGDPRIPTGGDGSGGGSSGGGASGGSYPDDTADENGCSWTKPYACLTAALKWAFVPQQASLDQFSDLGEQTLETFPMSWFSGFFASVDMMFHDCGKDVGVNCGTRSLVITIPGTSAQVTVLAAEHEQLMPLWAEGVIRAFMWLSFVGGIASFMFRKSLPVVNE